MRRSAATLAVVAGAYVAAQMMADIASLRIISVFGYAVDAGTLVYPFTFTIRDIVHKVGGKHVARALIVAAAVINLIMAGIFWLSANLEAAAEVGPQLAFGEVLSPVIRIVLASIVAEVISELIDTEVYERWVARFGSTFQWGRVLSSNAVALPIDSVLFAVIAFAGTMGGATLIEVIVLNVIIKSLVTLISLPAIYLVSDQTPGPEV